MGIKKTLLTLTAALSMGSCAHFNGSNHTTYSETKTCAAGDGSSYEYFTNDVTSEHGVKYKFLHIKTPSPSDYGITFVDIGVDDKKESRTLDYVINDETMHLRPDDSRLPACHWPISTFHKIYIPLDRNGSCPDKEIYTQAKQELDVRPILEQYVEGRQDFDNLPFFDCLNLAEDEPLSARKTQPLRDAQKEWLLKLPETDKRKKKERELQQKEEELRTLKEQLEQSQRSSE